MPYLDISPESIPAQGLQSTKEMADTLMDGSMEPTVLTTLESQTNPANGLLMPPTNGHTASDQNGDAMEGVEPLSSRPPSPPDSRSETPRLSIAPCPVRLRVITPPKNYGAVESGKIFRSGFPHWNNVGFLEKLKLKSLITLVDEELSMDVNMFLSVYDITHTRVPISPNKDGRSSTLDSLCEAILLVMNPTNHPVYIHCNQGKHRTGCVVACLRKIQKWPIEEILREYDAYASPKARPGDIELIKAFDPACVYDYAKEHDLLVKWPRNKRKDSAADIWDLAAWLPPHCLSQVTDSDSDDDDGLTMTKACIDPILLTPDMVVVENNSPTLAGPQSNVSITEVDETDEDVHVASPEPTQSDSADTTQDSVVFQSPNARSVAISADRPRLR